MSCLLHVAPNSKGCDKKHQKDHGKYVKAFTVLLV